MTVYSVIRENVASGRKQVIAEGLQNSGDALDVAVQKASGVLKMLSRTGDGWELALDEENVHVCYYDEVREKFQVIES